MGSIDLLRITNCAVKPNNDKCFNIEAISDKNSSTGINSNTSGEINRYEIYTNKPEECQTYVGSINYLSQLVKTKAGLFVPNEKLIKNKQSNENF